MNIIEEIVKLYYKIPRYEFKIHKKYSDKRNFEWYKERKKLGFDERELWNLSFNMEDFINKKYGFIQTEKNRWGDLKGMVSYREIYRDIFNKKYNILQEINEHIYPRLKAYIEWNCPISVYVKEDSSFLSQNDIKDELTYLLKNLESFKKGEYSNNKAIKILCKYFYNFGW